jgi:hypothetical protein
MEFFVQEFCFLVRRRRRSRSFNVLLHYTMLCQLVKWMFFWCLRYLGNVVGFGVPKLTGENWLRHLLLYAPPGTDKIACPAALNESKLYFPASHSCLLSTI